MENECGNCGVWKMRTMKNEKWGKCGVFIIHMYMFFFFLHSLQIVTFKLTVKRIKKSAFSILLIFLTPHSTFSIQPDRAPFGQRFRCSVDGKRKRTKKWAFSNENALVWTGLWQTK